MRLWLLWGLLALLLPGLPLAARAPVVVEINQNFPPYEFVNAKGEPDGYDVDVIKAAAAVMDLPLVIRAASWPTVQADLEAGRIDVAPGVLYSLERSTWLAFCPAHLVVHYSIFVRKGEAPLASLDDLRGRKVLVERGSQMEEFLTVQGLWPSVVSAASETDALRQLASGAQDAAIAPRLTGLEMIRDHHLGNIKPVAGSVFARDLCFALPYRREELKESLDTGLAILNGNGEYDAIYRKWFGHLEPSALASSQALRLAAGTILAVLLLLLAALAWSGTLKRQVRERTGELRRATAALQDNVRLLAAIVDTLPLALFAKDPADGYRYVLWNNQCEAIFGLGRDQVLGRTDWDIWSAEEAAAFRVKDEEVIERGLLREIPEERVASRSRGPILLHTIKAAVPDAQGRPCLLLALSEDITERRRLETERLALEARLQETQKLESLGSLAGGVAHDMNNVLGSILGLATAYQAQAGPGTPLAKALETITKACVRGGTMVRGLLAFARRSLTEERQLDLNSLVRDETQLLEHTTLAQVRLEMDLAGDLRPVRGDAAALSHALMNLCVNAVDAMEGSGVLTLSTRGQGSWVELQVQDTGCGMTEAVLAKAMDPFFTTKRLGTGLGLSIVQSTVKAHHGQLAVESWPGQGTRITLRFPAWEPVQPAVSGQPEQGLPKPNRALAILVVDDDELIRSSLADILEVLGHSATTVDSGEAALVRLEAGLQPQAVILDMNMPGLSGAETLPRLRILLPLLPVILCTGRADQTALDLAAGIPGVTLLAKPFTMAELEQVLNRI